jgi:hypothetical protein
MLQVVVNGVTDTLGITRYLHTDFPYVNAGNNFTVSHHHHNFGY